MTRFTEFSNNLNEAKTTALSHTPYSTSHALHADTLVVALILHRPSIYRRLANPSRLYIAEHIAHRHFLEMIDNTPPRCSIFVNFTS